MTRPRPAVTRDTEFFWRDARAHRLSFQRCDGCGTLRHPPTAACAACGSPEWTTLESAGRGTVFSFTVLHEPLPEPFAAPHVGVLVELDEGVRLVSELTGVEPADVHIGLPVQLDWLDCDDGLTIPRFRPT